MNRHEFDEAQWNKAKVEGKRILMDIARQHGTITYSDLAAQIPLPQLDPHDPRLAFLLREISIEEVAAGRGMLSALVVHIEDGRPGQGFFNLAKELSHHIKNNEEFWNDEVKRVYAAWTNES